jgi:hypothetical protein
MLLLLPWPWLLNECNLLQLASLNEVGDGKQTKLRLPTKCPTVSNN